MLLTHEIDRLMMTVNDAIDLAAEGKVAGGYVCLVWGLHRAEEMADEGIDWGEELVGRWRTAVENNCTRYGVKMG